MRTLPTRMGLQSAMELRSATVLRRLSLTRLRRLALPTPTQLQSATVLRSATDLQCLPQPRPSPMRLRRLPPPAQSPTRLRRLAPPTPTELRSATVLRRLSPTRLPLLALPTPTELQSAMVLALMELRSAMELQPPPHRSPMRLPHRTAPRSTRPRMRTRAAARGPQVDGRAIFGGACRVFCAVRGLASTLQGPLCPRGCRWQWQYLARGVCEVHADAGPGGSTLLGFGSALGVLRVQGRVPSSTGACSPRSIPSPTNAPIPEQFRTPDSTLTPEIRPAT